MKTLLSSPLLYWAILFNIIGFFTWGFGYLTFSCLLLVVYLLYSLSRGQVPALANRKLFPELAPGTRPSPDLKRALILVLGITVLGMLVGLVVAPNNWLLDIGLNTYLACESLAKGLNPYATMAQAWYTIDAGAAHVEVLDEQVYMFGVPYYYGYPYFPVMMLSYMPFTLLIEGYDAIRVGNVVLVIANVAAVLILVRRMSVHNIRRSQYVAVIAYLCIGVYWFEMFWHGIVDILLSTLLLYTFVFLQRHQFVLAGIVLGLAQAAKLLPPPLVALCIMYFLLGREGFWKFSVTYSMSSLALMLPFVLLDYEAFVSATILFYLTNHSVGDSTSLWFFLPEFVRQPFTLLGYVSTLAMIVIFIRRDSGQWVDVMAAAFACYLMLIAFSKMSHLNYIWAVYPLGCVAFALLLERLPYEKGTDLFSST